MYSTKYAGRTSIWRVPYSTKPHEGHDQIPPCNELSMHHLQLHKKISILKYQFLWNTVAVQQNTPWAKKSPVYVASMKYCLKLTLHYKHYKTCEIPHKIRNMKNSWKTGVWGKFYIAHEKEEENFTLAFSFQNFIYNLKMEILVI